MKNSNKRVIDNLTEQLEQLKIRQRSIDRDIQQVQQQLRDLTPRSEVPETITTSHIGQRCVVLNPNRHQPSEGTIVGFSKGRNPFVKVKEKGFVEIRRLPKNLRLKDRSAGGPKSSTKFEP